MKIALTEGVPLELLATLDDGKAPSGPPADLLVVMFAANRDGLIELGRADSAKEALRTIIDTTGITGEDVDTYWTPWTPAAFKATVSTLRSARIRELALMLQHSFQSVKREDFADDPYLGNCEADFPEYEPVIGWSALSSGGTMSDTAFAILERRSQPTTRAAVDAKRLERLAKQLRGKVAERADAVHHLGLMGRDVAIPLLVEALSDRSSEVQIQAGETLASLGSEAAIAALLGAIPNAPALGVQAGIVALGRRVVPLLQPFVETHGPFVARCLGRVAEERSRIDEPTAAMLLAIARQKSWRSHMAVIPILASHSLPHLPEARGLLEQYLESSSAKVRKLAADWITVLKVKKPK
jgi:hypothetical protein